MSLLLIKDCWQMINDKLSLKNNLSLMSTCSFLYSLKIKKLSIYSKKYTNINDQILSQSKYDSLSHIELFCYVKIDLSVFKNLQILYLCGNFDQDFIPKNIQLKELHLQDCSHINIPHQDKLEILSVNGLLNQVPLEYFQKCGTKIKQLNISNNRNVTNISAFQNVNVLYASGLSVKLTSDNLNLLNLTRLYINNNRSITNLDRLSQISVLHIANNNCLTVEHIKHLNLIEINLTNNSLISDLSYFSNLKVLYASGSSAVNQQSINKLNLTYLDCSDNKNIINISHMSRLTTLIANGIKCGLTQEGLKGLNLSYLQCNGNIRIYDVSFMTKLMSLSISGQSNVGQKGIVGLNLVSLNISYNQKIRDISWMTSLAHLTCYDFSEILLPTHVFKISPSVVCLHKRMGNSLVCKIVKKKKIE